MWFWEDLLTSLSLRFFTVHMEMVVCSLRQGMQWHTVGLHQTPASLSPLYSDSTAPKGSKDREWFSGRVVEIMGEKFKCQILTMRDLVSSPRVRT